MSKDWNWKDKAGQTAGLLYEPGNWGDMLKGIWVTRIVRSMAAMPGMAWEYRDVFAGAMDYPLTRKTLIRLALLSDTLLPACAESMVASGRWPSAASLAHAAAQEASGMEKGTSFRWVVMDGDDERAASYEACSWCEKILIGNGWESALNDAASASTLLVLDPYDCLAGAEQALGTIRARLPECSLLLYVYNRSGRGGEYLRAYRAFRNALDDIREDARMLVGRVAADGFLPTAHHEMIFLPHATTWSGAAVDALTKRLAAETAQLSQVISQNGVFEEA